MIERLVAPNHSPEGLYDRLVSAMLINPPPGWVAQELSQWFGRNRAVLLHMIEERLKRRSSQSQWRPHLPELWSEKERTEANITAMRVLHELMSHGREPTDVTDGQRATLSMYSGWGGLSVERHAHRFPPGLTIEARSLIHEFYTPTRIAADILTSLLPVMRAASERKLRILEPSAGIGRFVHAWHTVNAGQPIVQTEWTLIELSMVSATLLRYLYGHLYSVFNMPFEKFVTNSHVNKPQYDFVLSNPPYGVRGELLTVDSDPSYRHKNAYQYFMHRGLELLTTWGIGVFLIPAGFLSGSRAEKLRTELLRSNHLMAAFRLPSESQGQKDPIFPGANLVTDILFWRRRPGRLVAVLEDDVPVVQGRYFEQYPTHILGSEINRGDESDEYAGTPRRRYAVVGAYKGLPPLTERPIGQALYEEVNQTGIRQRGSLTRERAAEVPAHLQWVQKLGARVETYLASLASDVAVAQQMYSELISDLRTMGNPHTDPEIMELARRHDTGINRLLTVVSSDGTLIEELRRPPHRELVYRGEPSIIGQALWLWRTQQLCTLGSLTTLVEKTLGHAIDTERLVLALLENQWCQASETEWQPPEDYYTGYLWRHLDWIEGKGEVPEHLKRQRDKLRELIAPLQADEIIETLSPRDTFIPISVLNAWMSEGDLKNEFAGNWSLTRTERGILTLLRSGSPIDLSALHAAAEYSAVVWFIGYANHYSPLFSVPREKRMGDNGEDELVPLDETRQKWAQKWTVSLRNWLSRQKPAAQELAASYNRLMRGYVTPRYSAEPLPIARWTKTGPQLRAHQIQAARRLLRNRKGLLAFDVGVGKTYTGLATLAAARQEGWARRPVVIVPNSIIWKWYRDFARVLPDYNVAVIGSVRRTTSKERVVAEPDTPAQRAEKWTAFQAGRYDAVLLTYSALSLTRMNAEALEAYTEQTMAIWRQIELARERAKAYDAALPERKIEYEKKLNRWQEAKRKAERAGEKFERAKPKPPGELSERNSAVLRDATASWLARQLEATSRREYDPGIVWDDLGVDFLMVDESQNFKNLFMPEEREGGIPDAMGGTTESRRAWQLDLRCASVRARTGGAGVFLLSATPAKNGPLEFYNALHLVDNTIWQSRGILNSEAFIDRYCLFENRYAQSSSGAVVERSTCVAFQNLHELRTTLNQYAEFKTAEDVGLTLPQPFVLEHYVDLNEMQKQRITQCWIEVLELKDRLGKLMGDKSQSMRKQLIMQMTSLASRVDLLAIHPDLPAQRNGTELGEEPIEDEGMIVLDQRAIPEQPREKESAEAHTPHSPKLDAVVAEILRVEDVTCLDEQTCLACGHIIFAENIKVHAWMVACLVEAGIPEGRIAVLNAEVADTERRQVVAERFNGVGVPGDEDYAPPQYDIVIANAVAYEGIDLQRRTCAIHHIDLPWEPATLQQRNGRAVRQGNRFERISIHYYYGRPSGDGRKLAKIVNKRSWMISLLHSQDRKTNNPSAAVQVNVMEMLLDILPEKHRKRYEAEQEQQRQKVAEEARQTLYVGANRRLQKALTRLSLAYALEQRDPGEAKRLRTEADEHIAYVLNVDHHVWPWAGQVTQPLPRMWVATEGVPIHIGQTFRARSGNSFELMSLIDDGIADQAWVRRIGLWKDLNEALPSRMSATSLSRKPEDLRVEVPPEQGDAKLFAELLRRELVNERWSWDIVRERLRALEWWLDAHWSELELTLKTVLPGRYVMNVPLVQGSRLVIITGREVYQPIKSELHLIAPTPAGYTEFCRLAPASEYAFRDANACALAYFGTSLPMTLYSDARKQTLSTKTESLRHRAYLPVPEPTMSLEKERQTLPPILRFIAQQGGISDDRFRLESPPVKAALARHGVAVKQPLLAPAEIARHWSARSQPTDENRAGWNAEVDRALDTLEKTQPGRRREITE